MPLAYLKTNLRQSAIDPDKGIITGVKIMQVGKMACFQSMDGAVKRVKITAAHVEALMAHAGNRAIPVHLTHDWADAIGKPSADSVEMAARIGALKTFRKDDEGDLVADLYLKDAPARKDILWGAEHNPEDNMLSAVFSYAKDDASCLPVDFKACDVVPKGAATTALFSEVNQNEPMDKTALLKLLADPEVKAALLALNPTGETDPAKNTALMAAVETRTKSLATEQETALLAKIDDKLEENKVAILKEAEAKVVSAIGANPALRDFTKHKEAGGEEFEQLVTAQLTAGAPNRATAILRVAKDKPDIYNEAVKTGKI